MLSPRSLLLGILITLPVPAGAQPKTFAGHMAQAEKSEPHVALTHLTSALTAWDGTATKELGRRWLDLLKQKARSFADVETVLKGRSPQVRRQVLYQRYLEYRLYDVPVRFAVVVEVRHGRDPELRGIE